MQDKPSWVHTGFTIFVLLILGLVLGGVSYLSGALLEKTKDANTSLALLVERQAVITKAMEKIETKIDVMYGAVLIMGEKEDCPSGP